MFSNTAYEAVYQYLGLELHSAFIDVITSQRVFAGIIVLIFGIAFFMTTIQFFSRYISSTIIKRNTVPLSKFVKITACLFLGMSLLKVQTETSVKKFTQSSWHTNAYIKGKLPDIERDHKVSFVFDILSRAADEIARFTNAIVDDVFKVTNSELEAPSFFYKSIMLAGVQSIDDPILRDKVDFYADECFEKILPSFGRDLDREGLKRPLNEFFQPSKIDRSLSEITIKMEGGETITCLDLKEEVVTHLHNFASQKAGALDIPDLYIGKVLGLGRSWSNLAASNALVNHFHGKTEGYLGIKKGSQLPTITGKAFQYLNRLFSWDGALSIFGENKLHGAALAAKRSQEFSENLQRAPHLAGFIKMTLIFIFPWLIFFVVAGKWKILPYWFALYLSVSMWAPIWTLLYHIVTNLALSAETMSEFGRLGGGISLYGSQLITSRIYHMYSVYSYLQLIVGTAPTLLIAWQLMPLLRDGEQEHAPEFIDSGTRLARKVSTGGL